MSTTTPMRVGELAARSGISVRTLHYYEEIGLLTPTERSESGYRLYGEAEVMRLQQIVSLRQLGLSLEEIRDLLVSEGISPLAVIELQVDRLQSQIRAQQQLCEQLEGIARHLRTIGTVSVDALFDTLELMTMAEKYYTPEQLEWLKERAKTVGEERIKEVEAEWPRLIAQVQAEMDAGTDPTDERVQELARRWHGLVAEFTGGNPEISQALEKMWSQETSLREQSGISVEMSEYIAKAAAAAKLSE